MSVEKIFRVLQGIAGDERFEWKIAVIRRNDDPSVGYSSMREEDIVQVMSGSDITRHNAVEPGGIGEIEHKSIGRAVKIGFADPVQITMIRGDQQGVYGAVAAI